MPPPTTNPPPTNHDPNPPAGSGNPTS
jgi:hypothetical protein